MKSQYTRVNFILTPSERVNNILPIDNSAISMDHQTQSVLQDIANEDLHYGPYEIEGLLFDPFNTTATR